MIIFYQLEKREEEKDIVVLLSYEQDISKNKNIN